MKPSNPDAARVWQRVLSPESGEQQTLQAVIWQLSSDAAYLTQYFKARENPLQERLLREYAAQLHCLKGLLLLTGGPMPKPSGSLSDRSLRRCYDNALQRLGTYQLRSADPVYGPVFRELARQAEYHCFCIAQLLGSSIPTGKEKGR